jgi:predicted esterase
MSWATFHHSGAAAVSAAVVIGSALVGAAIASRLYPRVLVIPDCTHVQSGGGVVAGVRYLEQMRGGAHPGDKVPMVIVLHSLGARPEGYVDMFAGLGPARVIAPEGGFGDGKIRKWWHIPVRAAIEDPTKKLVDAVSEWTAAADRLERFVQEIVRCRPTQGKPIITGSSQGGEMTLLMASRYPRLFAGAVATASYLLPVFWTSRMSPTRMVHGTGDTVVPFAWAQQYYETMHGEGAELEFAGYETDPSHELGHYVTTPMGKDWSKAVSTLVEQQALLATRGRI